MISSGFVIVWSDDETITPKGFRSVHFVLLICQISMQA